MSEILRRALLELEAGTQNLGANLIADVFKAILEDTFDPPLLYRFLAAWHQRGETFDEILTGIRAVRLHQKPGPRAASHVVDVGGTGGDGGRTFNISTTAALLSAAAGVRLYKHGSARASSKCGSIDVLRELELPVAQNRTDAELQFKLNGIAFLDGNAFQQYPAPLQKVRRQLKTPSIFNLIGPWCNPTRTKRQIIGVFRVQYLPVFARIARALEYEHVLLIHGVADFIDEFSVAGPTLVIECHGERQDQYYVRPEDYGLMQAPTSHLRGGDSAENARISIAILDGTDNGPRLSTVLMTAGACGYLAGTSDSIGAGVHLMKKAIESGQAASWLNRLRVARERRIETWSLR